MLYLVQVDQNALRARSDPMDATTALKVAKAWQSHGDRGVRIVEAGDVQSPMSWSIREFIAFTKQPAAVRFMISRPADRADEDTVPQEHAARP